MAKPAPSQLQIKINRLKAKRSGLEQKQKRVLSSERKARTRTLIQLGGLINMIGLPELCGIREGDDLQFDIESMNRSAVLLGLLTTLQEQIPPTLTEEEIDLYKNKGIRTMKIRGMEKIQC